MLNISGSFGKISKKFQRKYQNHKLITTKTHTTTDQLSTYYEVQGIEVFLGKKFSEMKDAIKNSNTGNQSKSNNQSYYDMLKNYAQNAQNCRAYVYIMYIVHMYRGQYKHDLFS